MSCRRLIIAGTMLASFLAATALAGPVSTNAKPVMVYYMPWYAAKPFDSEWGWHWTMDHFNPDKITTSGEKEIASWYYPLIGPYDSADPAVLEYHVLLMKMTGISGVIVDWYGSADFYDYASVNRNTSKLFEYTRKAGLKFAVCYEDQTIQRLIEGKRLMPGDAVSHAQQEMLYLQTNFFCDPSYFRLNGRPLLENFGPQYFLANSNWDAIFSVLEQSNRPAFFTEDNRLEPGLGAFDWPPMWLSQKPGTGGVLSEAALKTYLTAFENKSGEWPAFISSAFPRFHDIYQRAGTRNYWGYLGDRNGETLRETLNRALTNNSAFVQIVTWNDFGEGTTVEPTKEYGFRDLFLIRELCGRNRPQEPAQSTTDLTSAYRLYCLRRDFGTNATASLILDQTFKKLILGQQESAREQMAEFESMHR